MSDGLDKNKQTAHENFLEEKLLGSVLQIYPKIHADEQRCVTDIPSSKALELWHLQYLCQCALHCSAAALEVQGPLSHLLSIQLVVKL